MKKYAVVVVRTKELNEFDIIDWDIASNSDISRDDYDTENVGEFIHQVIENHGIAYDWGVCEVGYDFVKLKSGIYKHSFNIYFNGYEEDFENPLHLLGMDGETKVKWL